MLVQLLDTIKTRPASEDLTKLYKEYGVDAKRMRELRRWVNSPSVENEDVKLVDG